MVSKYTESYAFLSLRFHFGAARRFVERAVCLIEKDSFRGSVEILELTAALRPHEGAETDSAEQQGDRNKPDERIHEAAAAVRIIDGSDVRPVRPPLREILSALATTRIEESDIAIAAISGVTKPASATGMTSAL